MALLGAHMSIAGGYYKAVEAAAKLGMETVQLFTKNNNQWRAKEITEDDIARYRAARLEHGIEHHIAHNSYLINMASPDDTLWKRSIDAMVVELQRAEQLEIPYVVAHPGAYTTSSEETGLQRIIQALDEVFSQTRDLQAVCLLETTAGQGSNLGCKFEHLATLIEGCQSPERLGVCFDTCHVFAAGYPLGTEEEYQSTFRAFDETAGIEQIKAFHVNDSKAKFGSRVDRHAKIGAGEMGLEPFRLLLNDPRFRAVPMFMETPKGKEDGEDLDAINLQTLRSLIVE